MNRALRRFSFMLLILLSSSLCVSALTVKLASPLPESTEWDAALRRMADQWRDITNGSVRVQIYPGGIAGGEGDMVRKMRFGQLDAGVFTAFGLKVMVPETLVLTLPGLIRDDRELDWILEEYVGRFDGRFREEGFEMLAWSKSGWAYPFGKRPIRTPDDLRRQALAVDSSENDIASAFKFLGFNVVPVSLNELMISLQSGLAEAFMAPPVGAAAYQWFALAPNMTEYRLAPVVGCLVISQRTWSRIPAEYHEEMKASMAEVARAFRMESDRLNDEALRVMSMNGLKRITPNSDEMDEWKSVMMSGHELMVGDDEVIPTAVYTDILKALESLR